MDGWMKNLYLQGSMFVLSLDERTYNMRGASYEGSTIQEHRDQFKAI